MTRFKNNDRGAVWHTITVVSVIEYVIYSSGSRKVVFWGQDKKEPRKIIYWGDIQLNTGDKLQVQGWIIEDGIFLCKRLLRLEKAVTEEKNGC